MTTYDRRYYDSLCADFIVLFNPGKLPDLRMDDLARYESRIAIEVYKATGLSRELWNEMKDDLPAREPYIKEAMIWYKAKQQPSKQSGQPSKSADGVNWLHLAEVARKLSVSKPTVARMIDRSELTDNGQKGAKRRVSAGSFLRYCKDHGVTLNET